MTERYERLVFVDCEARGTSPVNGTMTEFGAVHYTSRQSFRGQVYEGKPDPENPAVPLIGNKLNSERLIAVQFGDWLERTVEGRPVFVSDNPAYDWQWISALFDRAGMENPFGHSARRISDFWAGLQGDWSNTQKWKKLRRTAHDHNPVNDAMGNVEAFAEILKLARPPVTLVFTLRQRGYEWTAESGELEGFTASDITREAAERKARRELEPWLGSHVTLEFRDL